ncbi:MAG: hypothetical protein BWK75_03020 [Candidatus Altiarchaeales archaeon A3]|nr:MAG: hypothetical protein BWK75_03020 [Candidatus Altiarchaeales archaeon A3]
MGNINNGILELVKGKKLNLSEVSKKYDKKKLELGNILGDDGIWSSVLSEYGIPSSDVMTALNGETKTNAPQKLIKISDIGKNQTHSGFTLVGKFIAAIIGTDKTIQKSDGTVTKKMTFGIYDGTGGFLNMDVWGENVDKIMKAKPDDVLRITNIRLKAKDTGGYYINSSTIYDSEISLNLDEDVEAMKSVVLNYSNISDLANMSGNVVIKGVVINEVEYKQTVTKDNKTAIVTSFNVADNTGNARVSAWKNIEKKGLLKGATVKIFGNINKYTDSTGNPRVSLKINYFSDVIICGEKERIDYKDVKCNNYEEHIVRLDDLYDLTRTFDADKPLFVKTGGVVMEMNVDIVKKKDGATIHLNKMVIFSGNTYLPCNLWGDDKKHLREDLKNGNVIEIKGFVKVRENEISINVNRSSDIVVIS